MQYDELPNEKDTKEKALESYTNLDYITSPKITASTVKTKWKPGLKEQCHEKVFV